LDGCLCQQDKASVEVTEQGEVSVQISISARHGHVSAATQEKITEKVEKLRRYFDRVTAIEVMVDLEHREAVEIEIRVSVEHAPDFVASETAVELFVALDAVVHKLEQQLRKHKERIQTVHRQPGRKQIEVPLEPEPGIE
jgi:putative sigma-54 modulation protein